MLDYERVPSSVKENMQMLMSLLTLENTAFCDSRTLFSRINNICVKDQYWIYVWKDYCPCPDSAVIGTIFEIHQVIAQTTPFCKSLSVICTDE